MLHLGTHLTTGAVECCLTVVTNCRQCYQRYDMPSHRAVCAGEGERMFASHTVQVYRQRVKMSRTKTTLNASRYKSKSFSTRAT
jgi:hypothetical protein